MDMKNPRTNMKGQKTAVDSKESILGSDGDSSGPHSNSLESSLHDSTSPKEGGDGSKQGSMTIGRAEDRAVFRSRLLVVAFLAICTVAVGTLVYFDTSQREQEEMEAEFEDFASKISDSLGSSMEASVGAIDAFVVSMVSFAKYSNMTWPYVTIPDFGIRASKVRAVSKAIVLNQVVFVPKAAEEQWNNYSMQEGPVWVDQNLRIQNADPGYNGVKVSTFPTPTGIYLSPEDGGDFVRPVWQSYPTLPILGAQPAFNLDGSIIPSVMNAIPGMLEGKAIIGGVANDPISVTTSASTNAFIAPYLDPFEANVSEPLSEIAYPIYTDASDRLDRLAGGSSELVAGLITWFSWKSFLVDILPNGGDGVIVVFENACNQTFSYRIDGPNATFQGYEDVHDDKYDGELELSFSLGELSSRTSHNSSGYTGAKLSDSVCPYVVSIFPSKKFAAHYQTSSPAIYTAMAVAIFVFTTLVFLAYDFLVERRQKKVMSTAMKSSAIVSSLFPSNVRARLYDLDDLPNVPQEDKAGNKRLWTLRNDQEEGKQVGGSFVDQCISTGRPIADLFPSATVMFGDISGFTAWSSTRQPHQVFILLESLYGLFDKIADRRGIFKVETIGDCYMAVAGLPDPRPDHAIACAKFASECCKRMVELTSKLSVTLGPDTELLGMRFGLNSGPVTAGVLRGQKTRFQLFGDTVNTASRMESTGRINRIQATESTAIEIRKHNKGHWLRSREDQVEAKGKGKLTTFWVNPNDRTNNSYVECETDGGSTPDLNSEAPQNEKMRMDRLVDWNVEVLARLLCSIEAQRLTCLKAGLSVKETTGSLDGSLDTGRDELPSSLNEPKNLIIDEVKEIVPMAKFFQTQVIVDPNSIELDPKVLSELKEYVISIANVYARFENSFHNFEHASHVCMSVAKLMSRIVAAADDDDAGSMSDFAKQHERTFGITSDPLAIFACAFSALIHDVDHQGVPNSQLVKERSELASKYHNRSVAEQHSIDVAWSLLMMDHFSELRQTIASTGTELQRFRQLVVNGVMATDIMDKDLKQLRNERWERAFQKDSHHHHHNHHQRLSSLVEEARNRKATIVIEHLIQASDVAHTMQHWHVYRKWNQRLFEEMSEAYEAGRSEKDPAAFWYKGELGFFDFYILPLAKKLSDCGVFGVSSDEYLNYALKNREEWELKGQEIVERMVKERTTKNASRDKN